MCVHRDKIKLNRLEYSEDFLKYVDKNFTYTKKRNSDGSVEETATLDIPDKKEYPEEVSVEETRLADDVEEEILLPDPDPAPSQTALQYIDVINMCRDVFFEKLQIYGPSWRVLHKESITDQIYIRVNKIINMLQDKCSVDELISEIRSIVNYGIIYLIQNTLGCASNKDISIDVAIKYFDEFAQRAYDVMSVKNDVYYKESWRLLRLVSFIDFILMKILRIKEVEILGNSSDKKYDIENNYYDIINYALFALIQLA